MARTSTKRLDGEYDLEPKGSVFFLYMESTQLFRESKCDIMLVFKGAVFLLHPLYCCTLPDCFFPRELCSCYTEKSVVVFKRNLYLNLAYGFVICSECSFRKSCPRELAHSPSYLQRSLELRRILSHRTPA